MKKDDFNHDRFLNLLKNTFPNNDWMYRDDFVYCGYFDNLMLEVWVGESDFLQHEEGFMRLEIEIDGIDQKFNEIIFYPKDDQDYDWNYDDVIPTVAKALQYERETILEYLSAIDKAINECLNKTMPTSEWH